MSEQDTKKEPSKKSAPRKENIDDVKAVSAVAYLGILFFVPMVTNPKSDFAMFHANQGLLLLIASFIGYTVSSLLVVVLIGVLLFPIVSIFVFICFIMGILNAMNGEKRRLPLIGGYDLIKPQA